MTLWKLSTNCSAKISGFSSNISEDYRQRLREIGFEKDAEVSCLKAPPFSGPKVFQIGDSVFSLAKDIAELVNVEEQ